MADSVVPACRRSGCTISGTTRPRSLTQTAPDEVSEAGDEAPQRPKLQLIRGGGESPLSGSNRRPPLYKSGALAN